MLQERNASSRAKHNIVYCDRAAADGQTFQRQAQERNGVFIKLSIGLGCALISQLVDSIRFPLPNFLNF
jgi:hypothetical protein